MHNKNIKYLFGEFKSGKQRNVVSDETIIKGTIRVLNDKTIASIKKLINKAINNKKSLKITQKRELVQAIYNYPRKIAFAMLRPLDMNLDEIKKDLLDFVKMENIKKENGEEYCEKDILEAIQDSARATMLSVFNYFAEISTSPKSLELLLEKSAEDVSEMIQRLMIIESYGN